VTAAYGRVTNLILASSRNGARKLLFQVETFDGKIWDPACGIGRITGAAAAAGYVTDESDLIDRGRGYQFDLPRGRR
jgi:hypothetical protein